MQGIDRKVFDKFEKLLNEKQKKSSGSRVVDGGVSAGAWIRKVTDKVKISDVARRNGIELCPTCQEYFVNFDDSRGFFACQNHACDFKGNVVDFFDKTGVEIT